MFYESHLDAICLNCLSLLFLKTKQQDKYWLIHFQGYITFATLLALEFITRSSFIFLFSLRLCYLHQFLVFQTQLIIVQKADIPKLYRKTISFDPDTTYTLTLTMRSTNKAIIISENSLPRIIFFTDMLLLIIIISIQRMQLT